MKSIKIHKYTNSALPQTKQASQSYKLFISQDEKAPLKTKLMSIIGEICERVEIYSKLKLNIADNISRWLSKTEALDENQIMKEFRIFVLDMFDEYLAEYRRNENQSQNNSPVKLVRIKSEEKIKLKLLRDDEYGLNTEEQYQKQEESKAKLVHHLKQENKKLQKKVLLLTVEFNKIKKYYEHKMQKYKKLLSSSLSSFQLQIQNQLYGSNRVIQMNNGPTIKQVRKSVNSNGAHDRYTNSSTPRRFQPPFQKYARNKQQIITSKFVTIPSIPIFQAPKAKNK